MPQKVVLSLSGGLDSSTLLASLISQKETHVFCVIFAYGSKHNHWERQSAVRLASHYKRPFNIIDVASIFEWFRSDLLEGQGQIPEGHYNDESMKHTVVPARNLIFASILAGYAESIQATSIALGVHAGDHTIYPDCRPLFIQHLRNTVEAATDQKVSVQTPFLTKTKADIVKLGLELGVPYQMTRTCYKQQEIACGKCGSCVERREAFKINNVVDPIQYEETA